MLLAATCLVVIGLVLEYWHEIKDFWVHVRWPIAAFPWNKFAAISGGVLVTLGVAGELAFTYMASRKESQLRENNHRIEALLTKEAGEANERASKNEQQTAGLKLKAAELSKEAETERLARIQLAASISWRTPDRALIPQLSPPLQRFAGQRFAVVSDLGDPERMNVFSWIALLLGDAHWTFETARSTSELTFRATNIVLWVSPAAPNRVLEAARALVPALEHGGLSAVVLQSGWGPEPDAAPPELIRVVIFKKGPRMTVTGNMITFEGLPTRLFFGSGPPH